ncbi:MAG: hypothetical protein R2932_32615 [Caldilineaceae bacterium]
MAVWLPVAPLPLLPVMLLLKVTLEMLPLACTDEIGRLGNCA